MIEKRLQGLEGDFFGGKKMCIGDIAIFAFFCSAISNEHVNCPALRDACSAKLESAENVQAWHDAMVHEMKDYLATRPPRFV